MLIAAAISCWSSLLMSKSQNLSLLTFQDVTVSTYSLSSCMLSLGSGASLHSSVRCCHAQNQLSWMLNWLHQGWVHLQWMSPEICALLQLWSYATLRLQASCTVVTHLPQTQGHAAACDTLLPFSIVTILMLVEIRSWVIVYSNQGQHLFQAFSQSLYMSCTA